MKLVAGFSCIAVDTRLVSEQWNSTCSAEPKSTLQNAPITTFGSIPVSFILFNIQNDFSSLSSWTGGFGVQAGGRDILAFCQQAVWRTASLERKWAPPPLPLPPSGTRLCPPPLSFLGLGERTIWAGLLEWEVFNCQMLNRLCSLHLSQETRTWESDVRAMNAHTQQQTLPQYVNLWQKIKDDWWVESGCVEALRCVIVIWGQRDRCQRLSVR